MNKIFTKNKIILIITAIAISGFSVFYATAGIFKTNRQAVNDLTSGLVGYFTFDGQDVNWASGVVSDKSGYGNNRQISGMATSTNPVVGVVGQAMYFDGANDWAANSTAIGLPSGNSPFTISTWINISLIQPLMFVAGWGPTANYQANWLLLTSGKMLHINYGNSGDAVSNTTMSANTWYHAVVTYDGTTRRYYLNGSPDGSNTPQTMNVTNSNLTVAYDLNGNSMHFNGKIDEFRVYNRALTASEITELYNQGAKNLVKINTNQKIDIVPSGLTGYWTFDGPDINWTGATSGTVNNRGSTGGSQTLTNMSRIDSPAIGKIGQALNFKADNQHVNTGIISSNFITVSEGTISVWMKPSPETRSSTNVYFLPVVVGDGYDGWYGIYVGIIGGLNRIWIYNYDNTEDRIGVEYTPNEWVHIIWKHEGGNLYAYKNGVLVGFPVASGNTGGWSSFKIGHSKTYFGDLDEVRVYNRALTQSEIAELYNQGEKNFLKINMPQTDLIPSGLVGYWTFNGEGTNWATGMTNDRSGNGYSGQMINMSTSTSPAAGISGQALYFDNTNDRVVLANNSVATTLNDFTASAWVKPESVAGKLYRTIIGFGDSGDELFFGFRDGKIVLYSSDLAPNEKIANTTLTANNWQHAVFTRSGSNYNFYLNGDGDGNGTWVSTAIVFNNSSRVIGNDNFSGEEYLGVLDEVRIYNRALSANEVMELYRAGAGIN